MSHRDKIRASCERDLVKDCSENSDSDIDEDNLKREMDRIRKELGELSREEEKEYDYYHKERGTKKEVSRTKTSREKYRSPEHLKSSKLSSMKNRNGRDSTRDVSSDRSTSAERRRKKKERSAKRYRDSRDKIKKSRSKSPHKKRNWKRSRSRDTTSSGRKKRGDGGTDSGSRKDRCKKRNWRDLSNDSEDACRSGSGSKEASNRRTQKEKDKKKAKLMEAKEEEMSTKNFMRGLVDQIQNNQLVTDDGTVSSDKIACTEVERKVTDEGGDEIKEGVTKELDLEAYKSRILGGMAGGDESTSESPTKSESIPTSQAGSLQPAYNVVQSLSICQSFPKFSTFDTNPYDESSKSGDQTPTEAASAGSGVTVASNDSSVTSTENAQPSLQNIPNRPRNPTYRPRYTPETQLISKALRFYAPQLGGVRPNLDPRPASSNISNPPPFPRSRQPFVIPGAARPHINPQQSQNVAANMRPHSAILGQRNPVPMIRNIHNVRRPGVVLGMPTVPLPMAHRHATMGMTQSRPISAPGRGHAPFTPVRAPIAFRAERPAIHQYNAPNPVRHRLPLSNYPGNRMHLNNSDHHSSQCFVDDDTGGMNSFSEPRRLNLTTF